MTSTPPDAPSPGTPVRSGDLKLVGSPGRDAAAVAVDAAADDRVETDAQAGSQSRVPETPVERGGPSEEEGRRRVPLWLFLVVLVLLSLALGWQLRRIGALEAEVSSLQGELDQTTARLRAHRVRLTEIRGGVHDLADRLEGLRALVDADLEAAFSASEGAASEDIAEPGGPPGEGERGSLPARLPHR